MRGGAGKGLAALILLLCACSAKPAQAPADAAQDGGETVYAGSANPNVARLDPVSADFCQMRSYGPPELIAFLNTVETCDMLTSPGQRAQARCNTLSANETRLRARFGAESVVMSALNRARSRPWPTCPTGAAAPPEPVDEASSEEPAADEEPAEGDGE